VSAPDLAPPPQGTGRLFPHGVPLGEAHRGHLIARLLEEGDAADLRWLVEQIGEGGVTGWLRRRGGRALSHRSRVFWELVLDAEAGGGRPAAGDVWPHAAPPDGGR
jgi:hypothetical protein